MTRGRRSQGKAHAGACGPYAGCANLEQRRREPCGEMLWHVYVPGIAAHVFTGLRLAIGILWIVLVPAEMLGVSSGLGYLILDTRDRLAYSELTAVILVIGALGFLLDYAVRWIYLCFGTAPPEAED